MTRVLVMEGDGMDGIARRLRNAITNVSVTVVAEPEDDAVILIRDITPELMEGRGRRVIAFERPDRPRSYWLERGVESADPEIFAELVAVVLRELNRLDYDLDESLVGPGHSLAELDDVRGPMQPLRVVHATFQIVSQFCIDALIGYYDYCEEGELRLFAESEQGRLPDEIDPDVIPVDSTSVGGPVLLVDAGGCDRFPDAYESGSEVRCFVAPVESSTRRYGVLVVVERDVSQTKGDRGEAVGNAARQLAFGLESSHLFDQVRSAYGSLREAKDQLVHAEKFAAVGMLAAEIAHEINNPASFVITNLSVLGDYAETIEAFHEAVRLAVPNGLDAKRLAELEEEHEIGWLEEDVEVLIRRSLSGLERIHQIVQDLRFMSHAKPTSSGWVNVERLIEGALGLVRHEARFRAQILLDFGDVPMVKSDPNRLSQVFLNLLVNAVQAIEAGGIEENFVRVSTTHSDGSVVVSVEDSGNGISNEDLEQIFEPFFTTKEPGDGTGLGLSISRDIIRGLGGELSVVSPPGRGALFTVRLPAPAEAEHA